MATGQDIRITDVPFNNVLEQNVTVFINDRGKLRQTDLDTIAKYSQLYNLIIEAHNTAMDEIAQQLENGQSDITTLLNQYLDTLETTKDSLEQALVQLAEQKSSALEQQHTDNLTELTTLFEESMSRLTTLIEEGHIKLQNDVTTVDDLRTDVATLKLAATDLVLVLLPTDWVLDSATNLYAQTFELAGITASSTPVIGLVPTSTPTPIDEAGAYIHLIEAVTEDGALTFYADEALTIAITVVAKGVNVSSNTTATDIANLMRVYNDLKNGIEDLSFGNVTLWSGTSSDWATSKYITIDISAFNTDEYTMIGFQFGSGNKTIGGTIANVHVMNKWNAGGGWNNGGPIIEGKTAFWQVDVTNKKLYVWCNSNPTLPLRAIYLMRNL